MAIQTYMAKDEYFAYYFLDSGDIHVNIANCYRKGYKKFAERLNEVILQEVICKQGNIVKQGLCYAEQCPIRKILWRLK